MESRVICESQRQSVMGGTCCCRHIRVSRFGDFLFPLERTQRRRGRTKKSRTFLHVLDHPYHSFSFLHSHVMCSYFVEYIETAFIERAQSIDTYCRICSSIASYQLFTGNNGIARHKYTPHILTLHTTIVVKMHCNN